MQTKLRKLKKWRQRKQNGKPAEADEETEAGTDAKAEKETEEAEKDPEIAEAGGDEKAGRLKRKQKRIQK